MGLLLCSISANVSDTVKNIETEKKKKHAESSTKRAAYSCRSCSADSGEDVPVQVENRAVTARNQRL